MNSTISQYLLLRLPDVDAATLAALAQQVEVAQAAIALDASIDRSLVVLREGRVSAIEECEFEVCLKDVQASVGASSSQSVPVAVHAGEGGSESMPVASMHVAAEPGTGSPLDVLVKEAPALAIADEGPLKAAEPGVEEIASIPPAADLASPDAPSLVVELAAQAAPPRSLEANVSAVPVIQFTLKNMRQAEPGESELATVPEGQEFELVDVRFPDDLGLEFDADRKRILGTPKANGEFTLNVQYRATGSKVSGVRSAMVSLLVNPDPKLLWKDIPTDIGAVFWKEDRAQCAVEAGARRIIAARQRGRSHAHAGSFCEDDYQVAYLENGWIITVVADGAGSAKYARRGSRIACEAAAGRLTELLGGEAGDAVLAAAYGLAGCEDANREGHESQLKNALYVTIGYAAHAAMKAHCDELETSNEITSLRELATTLLIGVSHDVGGKQLCAAYWVGDGAIGVYRADSGVQILGDVDSGEYSGQTRFLDASEVSQEALLKRLRFALVDDFTAFILMTDGVSDAKFETEVKLQSAEAWDALWTDLEAGAQLSLRDEHVDERVQRWLEFWSPGNHDDRAIAIVY